MQQDEKTDKVVTLSAKFLAGGLDFKLPQWREPWQLCS